jgi:protein-tyrosine phosphatase
MRTSSLTGAVLGLLTVVVALNLVTAGERGVPGIDGIRNFGKVDEKLFRGAAPSESGVARLKELGAKSIIDLRLPSEVKKHERAAALANGLVYTNVPLRGLGAPFDEQVKTVLGLIDTLPSPVFIHCVYGCDRTGTMVACYRISYDHWSNEVALAEAKRYGLSNFERGMKKYIKEFGKTSNKTTSPKPSP